jgi:hypothetical protein
MKQTAKAPSAAMYKKSFIVRLSVCREESCLTINKQTLMY